MMRNALGFYTSLCSSILMVIVMASSALGQNSPPASAFEQQLIAQQKQFLEAAQKQNTSAIDRATAEDFQGIGPNGDFYDKGELTESAAGAPRDTRAYDFHVVKLNDGSAVVAYNLIVPGEHPRYRHMADTWAKIEGRWQLKFRQMTPNLWSANDVD
jgi:hypothetical protein